VILLLDAKHVAGIIIRSDGSGAYGGYATAAAKGSDTVELFGTGFGPTNPSVQPGQAFSGA
jgi:uncharacterized protein (TIGR03437 family)